MKLLIPLDQSDLSEAVLNVVRSTVLPLVTEAHLLAVAPLHDVRTDESEAAREPATYPFLFPIYAPEAAHRAEPRHRPRKVARQDLIKSIRHELVDVGSRLGENVRCVPVVVDSDDPARSIADYARRHRMDRIAMATHGRSGVARAVRGSVTDAVIRAGVAPVLVYHRPDG